MTRGPPDRHARPRRRGHDRPRPGRQHRQPGRGPRDTELPGGRAITIRPTKSCWAATWAARPRTSYNYQGRVYRARAPTRSSYNAGTGVWEAGDWLATDTWYDTRGNVVATRSGDGPITKSAYNGAGRLVETYTCAAEIGTTYDDVMSVADNTVVEQTQTWYNGEDLPVATATSSGWPTTPRIRTATATLTATNSYVTCATRVIDAAGRVVDQVTTAARNVVGGSPTAFFNSDGTVVDATGPAGIPGVVETLSGPAPNSGAYLVTETQYSPCAVRPARSPRSPPSGPLSTRSTTTAPSTRPSTTWPAGRSRPTRTTSTAAGGYGENDIITNYQFDTSGRLASMTVENLTADTRASLGLVRDNTLLPERTTYMYGSPYDGSLCTATVYPDSAGQLQENPQTGDWTLNTTAPTLKLRVGESIMAPTLNPPGSGPSIYMGNPAKLPGRQLVFRHYRPPRQAVPRSHTGPGWQHLFYRRLQQLHRLVRCLR